MDTSPITDVGRTYSRDDYFRYDNCWAVESDCIDRVHTAWQYTSGIAIDKLHAVGGALKDWFSFQQNVSIRLFLIKKNSVGLSDIYGDSTYFHACATERKKKNNIQGLYDDSGIGTDKRAEVANVVVQYFETLFT
ncbi:hypothetical protein V6N13_019800 [Hibiscus sabdariffa]